jgi:hypothetical protein
VGLDSRIKYIEAHIEHRKKKYVFCSIGSINSEVSMTMATAVLFIVSMDRNESDEWVVAGRAYEDVKIGDLLSDSRDKTPCLRVVAIESYGRNTDLLSKMMTGSLYLVGSCELEAEPRGTNFLYRFESRQKGNLPEVSGEQNTL